MKLMAEEASECSLFSCFPKVNEYEDDREGSADHKQGLDCRKIYEAAVKIFPVAEVAPVSGGDAVEFGTADHLDASIKYSRGETLAPRPNQRCAAYCSIIQRLASFLRWPASCAMLDWRLPKVYVEEETKLTDSREAVEMNEKYSDGGRYLVMGCVLWIDAANAGNYNCEKANIEYVKGRFFCANGTQVYIGA